MNARIRNTYIKGCISHAPLKSKRSRHSPALVSPHAGHGNPVSHVSGHTLCSILFPNTKWAIIIIIAHLAFFISFFNNTNPFFNILFIPLSFLSNSFCRMLFEIHTFEITFLIIVNLSLQNNFLRTFYCTCTTVFTFFVINVSNVILNCNSFELTCFFTHLTSDTSCCTCLHNSFTFIL